MDAEVLSKAKIAARAQDRTLTSYVAWLVRSAVQDAELPDVPPTKETWVQAEPAPTPAQVLRVYPEPDLASIQKQFLLDHAQRGEEAALKLAQFRCKREGIEWQAPDE
jgi:hypothetical protein